MSGNNMASKGASTNNQDEVDNNWFCFNDTKVSNFNPREIPNETYGGENENYENEMRQYAGDVAM